MILFLIFCELEKEKNYNKKMFFIATVTVVRIEN